MNELEQNTGVVEVSQTVRRTREVPFPGYSLECARLVQKALLDSDGLLRRYRLASTDIDAAWRWMAELREWRDGLWEVVGQLAERGWEIPWDLDLDPSPAKFILEWRALLLKAWPFVDPERVIASYQPTVTEH